MGNIELI